MNNHSPVLTVPNMDYISHIYEDFFTALGCRFCRPPELSDRTQKLGEDLGREGFCQPLNNCLGDLYLALQDDAEAVIVTAGGDCCRYGFYWASQKVILEEELGREVPFYVIRHESPRESVKEILDSVKVEVDEKRFQEVWRRTATKIRLLDRLNNEANRVRARAKEKEAVRRHYENIAGKIIAAESIQNTENICEEGLEQLCSVEQVEMAEPLRVLLIGPIYEVMEPQSNYHIEERLAELGVEVRRSMNHSCLAPIRVEAENQQEAEKLRNRLEKAKKHVGSRLLQGYGGYGASTISNAASASDRGYDGIIHLHSFSCMPEIVAKAFIRKISLRENIPSLTIVVEEIHSQKLFYNRLEAFVDVMKARRKQ